MVKIKFLSSLIFLTIYVLHQTYSNQAYGRPGIGWYGKCVERVYGVGDMYDGEKVSIPGQCMVAICNVGYAIVYQGCGEQRNEDPNCEVVSGNYELPYPNCCSRLVCYSRRRHNKRRRYGRH